MAAFTAAEHQHEEQEEEEYAGTSIAAGTGTATTVGIERLNPHLLGAAGDPRVHYNDQLEAFILTQPADGQRFIWDEDKSAWFPMFDEELMARQQSVYAAPPPPVKRSIDDVSAESSSKAPATKKAAYQQLAKKAKDKDKDTQAVVKISDSTVFVTGLPPDITVPELQTFFSKVGLILPDASTGKPRIKVYMDGGDRCNGEALVTYFRPESVQLALTILDETEIRAGCTVHVEKADFTKKSAKKSSSGAADGETATGKAPAPKKANRKLFEQTIMRLEKQLDWVEGDMGTGAEKRSRTVVLRHMFTQEELDKEPDLMFDLKEDVKQECEKFGEVTIVKLFDNHPDGVMTVRFKEKISVQPCIRTMNGRFFAGRQVIAHVDDGTEKFAQIGKETEVDEERRMENFASWIEQQQDGDDGNGTAAAATVEAAASQKPVESAATDSYFDGDDV